MSAPYNPQPGPYRVPYTTMYPQAPRRSGKQTFGIIALILGCVIAAIGGLILLVFNALRNSEAARTAIQVAAQHPEVTNVTGTPLKIGLKLTGSINTTATGGNANFNLPISGPKGRGSLLAIERRRNSVWAVTRLDFLPAGATKADMIHIIQPPMDTAEPGN
jgi:hypothetical protein